MSLISSLYVHFPFCETKCHYCDFYSLGKERTRDGDASLFERALTIESGRVTNQLAPALDTVFFGGGTPSMTPPEEMARAIAPLGLATRAGGSSCEWTMEANPSSIQRDRLEAYRTIGVNRISMGVQAMRNDHLELLGRVHDDRDAIRALEAIFEAGFTNASVDLLCGVPGQTLADLEAAMERLTSFPITHLSCYLLTLPPRHRLYSQLPNEEQQLEHLLLIDRFMTAAGFEHYEISNFAKPGFRARHNLNYWTSASYLGLGPSAHSFDAVSATRFKNVSSLHQYANLLIDGKSPVEWREVLTPEQRNLEKWMLALRLSDGFPESWLDSAARIARSAQLTENGLLERHPQTAQNLRLTPRGFALSDQVISALA